MYNLFDIFKQIKLISIYNNKIYLNNDLNRYIFSFLIEDYKKIINNLYFENNLIKLFIHADFMGKPIIIYNDYFPYPNSVKKINLQEIIDSKIQKYSNLYFSHYLYNNCGIYYGNYDNYYKRLFIFPN